jgi:hypothetical protein
MTSATGVRAGRLARGCGKGAAAQGDAIQDATPAFERTARPVAVDGDT